MALKAGTQEPPTDMTLAIYKQIQATLEPDLQGLEEKDLVAVRKGWRKLSFAIATGVVNYLVANMEIYGITTQDNLQNNDGPGHVR